MSKPAMSTVVYGVTPVQAFKGVAVYASYDGQAPDTEDLVLCASPEVADEVCDILNTNARYWSSLSFIEGCEYAKVFRTRFTCRETEESFFKSVADVFEKHDQLSDVDWDDPDLVEIDEETLQSLTEEEKEEIRKDFLEWSGGLPPKDFEPYKIRNYVELAMPDSINSEAAEEFLKAWQNE